MNKETYISVNDYAKQAEKTTQYIYHLGKTGKIKIETLAGFKVIDSKKYPPQNYLKK